MSAEDIFRAETRAWLEANCPPEKRGPMKPSDICFGGKNRTFKDDAQRLWLERMGERGWTAPEWPREYGGGGLTPVEANILREELARIEAHDPVISIGIAMLGPALLRFGTEEQKKRHLPPIARGEVWWCQGYSEPNAGSDLVSLQMRADLVGDEFIVTGQKIWTSYGDRGDMIFCLVRTDPSKPRYEGISFLLIDLKAPGVKASPLRLISGGEHFAQEFFDQVRVPKENLVGTLNRGWDVAKYLMMFERQMIGNVGMGKAVRLSEFALEHLGAERLRAEPMLRAQITAQDIEMTAFETMLEHFQEEATSGSSAVSAKSSMLKYYATELGLKRYELMMSVLGSAGLDMEGENAKTTTDYLFAYANRIGGGTSEIQLNIVSKRVLGLPGG